ncbi:serine/threonine-protein kinase [Streptomyces palmae]|uniref:non-specific serine/threonine protein kinase n=1 Tax=Streptomyces palmae TaxID=1701085 RepID=A0A4Z0GG14_9ACTN|nr:serine/threonine-protein kinase [Streptomyces palmae]TGA95178.1 serine/threonine protein kinase [Streptomyces palmae]
MSERDAADTTGAAEASAAGPLAAELSADDLALLGAEPLRRSDPSDIGPYRVLARLGSGGMGRLYLGREADTEGTYGARSLVAVKVIRSEYAEDERFRRRFEREVEAVRRVHGTYTAELLGSGFDGEEQLWMATAYVPGLSLADAVVRCGPLPVPVVWRLAHEIGQVLTAIAAVGIVHRDLKPSNVLLGPDGARVIDFGVAHTSDASSLTMTGQHLGTPAFMSPEQADGREVGTASDVFSLGSVLAVAVTGAGPFGEGNTADVIHRIVYSPPSEQILAEVSACDADLAELIGRCLEKDPGRRPGPQEIVEAARRHTRDQEWPGPVAETVAARTGWLGTAVAVRLMDQLTVLRRAEPKAAPEKKGTRRRWPLAVGAALVVAAATAVVAFAGPGQGSSDAEGAAAKRPRATATASPHGAAPGHRRPQTTPVPEVPEGNVPPGQQAQSPPPGYDPGPEQTQEPPSDESPDGSPDESQVEPPADAGSAPYTEEPAPDDPPDFEPSVINPPSSAPAKPWKSCAYYSGTRLTQYGDRGAAVKQVQCILRARGYSIGPSGLDGEFGTDTRTAVKRFQKARHLEVDGQVGVNTWRALRA